MFFQVFKSSKLKSLNFKGVKRFLSLAPWSLELEASGSSMRFGHRGLLFFPPLSSYLVYFLYFFTVVVV